MNFFDLLQSDSPFSPTLAESLLLLQQNWLYLTKVIDRLMNTLSFDKQEALNAQSALKSAKTPIRLLFSDYYKRKITDSLIEKYLPQVKELSNQGVVSMAELIRKVFETNRNFLEILEEGEYLNLLKGSLREKVRVSLLEESGLLDNLQLFIEREIAKFKKFIISSFRNTIDPVLLSSGYFSTIDTIDEVFDQNNISSLISIFIELDSFLKFEEILERVISEDLQFFMLSFEIESINSSLLTIGSIYFQTFLISFLQVINSQILNNIQMDSKSFSNKIVNLGEKLHEKCFEIFAKICKDKVFDLIINYPETEKIIFDLKEALEKSNMIFEIEESLTLSIQKRLLIPGVTTHDILNQYINILKILQILDKGLIFTRITSPIKSYLLKRTDTLRCIIALLTEDSDNYTKLVKEYVKIPAKEEQQFEFSSDEDESTAEKWDILPLKSRQNDMIRIKYQESDLVSVLVSLYGSQEAFISEYQSMLAEKMLGLKEFCIEEEIKNLELLKIRFGEPSLQNCNVIVKDVKESKRIDGNIHNNFDKKDFRSIDFSLERLHGLFASKGYWPINYECENFKMPNEFEKVFEDYGNKFGKSKAMRKLIWHFQLGFVNLNLEFDNGVLEVKCLPIHAVLLSFFDEKKIKEKQSISSEFLSKQLDISPNVVKQKMAFWVHKKVLREVKQGGQTKGENSATLRKFSQKTSENNTENELIFYYVNKTLEKDGNDEDLSFEENENSMILKDNSLSNFETNQYNYMIEGLISSMLTTNGPKTAEKIYNLLKTVYRTNISYPYNDSQTKEILRSMVMKSKIQFNGELYSATN